MKKSSAAGKTAAVPVKRMSLIQEIRKKWFFYLIPIPGIICLILFSYLPMAGLYVVFERYTYQGGLFGSEFVGLQNFKFFFMNMDNAIRATRNTLVINGFSIVLGVVVNVALAIMINEINAKRYRKITQSVMLFPYFISWIVDKWEKPHCVNGCGFSFFCWARGLFSVKSVVLTMKVSKR